jgi:hypothetical protein
MARTTRGALARPELSAGPRKALNDALHDLHRQAGWPSMRELAADVKRAGLMHVPPSHTRIHDAFTKSRLPQCELLSAVVRATAQRARMLDPRIDPDVVWEHFYALWQTIAKEQQQAYAALDVVAGALFDDAPAPLAVAEGVSNTPAGTRVHRPPPQVAETASPPATVRSPMQGLHRRPRSVLPDPAASRAVFIGTSVFDHLDDIPGVAAGLHDLSAAFTDPQIASFIQARTAVVHNPADASQALTPLETAAQDADDTLLLYIACHGLLSAYAGELSLALRGSRPQSSFTAVPYQWVRELVADSPAQRKIVFLDCCFSGRALEGAMSGDDVLNGVAAISGTYVMTASSSTRVAMAPRGERYTTFTGALLHTLTAGLPEGAEVLDLDTIYQNVTSLLRQRNAPLPQRSSQNTIGALGLARNMAYQPSVGTSPHI